MSKQLETLLRQTGIANEAQLARARERVLQQGAGSLLEVLLKEERVSEEAVADLFVSRLKVPRVRVAAMLLDPEAMKKVPEKIARKYLCLPISIEGRVLALAMLNPIDYLAIQDVEFSSGLSVRPLAATRTEIMDGIEERYGAEDRIGSFLANVPEVQDIQIMSEDPQDLALDVNASKSAAEVAPVVKMCNLVIHDAIRSEASDVHIEPALHDMQVRMRVDGVLRDYTRVPKWLHGPLVSRLKILAKLDIAERRLPQDGRVNVQYQGKSIDLRVSTLPTHFGEKIVLRVLGGISSPNIERIGLSPEQQIMLESAVAQPQGMILVTGPTGSGKSTTLYALLAKHHRPEINIITVEDPIEYQLSGINQVQINTKAGLNFASVLRSILRQDPDVILVGEMRDRETCEIAFQAAMTGHMVLSTLHTNSAVAAVSRLFDLGVDASIVANSLSMVVAQRLVRRICDNCREVYEPDAQVLARTGLGPDHPPVYRGAGCPACGNTGYAGRVGIYEVFRPTTNIRRLINDKASEAEIRNQARQSGLILLREDALAKIKAGLTSPDEVLRVVQVDETEVPCPHCGAIIEADFATCPYCAHSLKTSCGACGQSLKIDWKVCPYCNSTAFVQAVVDETPAPPVMRPTSDPMAGIAVPNKPLRDDERDEQWGWVRTIDPDAIGGPPAPPADTAGPRASGFEPRMIDPDAIQAPIGPPAPMRPVSPPPARDDWRAPVALEPQMIEPDRPLEPFAPPRAPSAPSAPAKKAPVPEKPTPRAPAVPPPVSTPPPPPAAPSAPAGQGPGRPPVAVPPVMAIPPIAPPPAPPAPPASAGQGRAPVFPLPPPVIPPIPARPAAARPQPPAAPGQPDAMGRRTMRILVVDDDPDIRMIVAATLRKLAVPVQIVLAQDGVDAVEKALANPPDMVVLDVMMPRMDGFGVCRALRENVRTAFVPVLMLTASADQGSRTQGYLVGTDDYMSKPFLPVDLNLRVTRLLRRTYGI
jgi:type IV pilus assembly protein PilB